MTNPSGPTSSLIGASEPRPDALGKVTGAARYPADLVRPDMLRLKVVFAGRPHARIRSLDTSAALAHPGVVAVLTAADVPYNAFGLIDADQPVLCNDVVRFSGDKVALVVAETQEAAETGAKLVQVEYEDLPVVTDARAALAPDAPLVHAELGSNLLLHIPARAQKIIASAQKTAVLYSLPIICKFGIGGRSGRVIYYTGETKRITGIFDLLPIYIALKFRNIDACGHIRDSYHIKRSPL